MIVMERSEFSLWILTHINSEVVVCKLENMDPDLSLLSAVWVFFF